MASDDSNDGELNIKAEVEMDHSSGDEDDGGPGQLMIDDEVANEVNVMPPLPSAPGWIFLIFVFSYIFSFPPTTVSVPSLILCLIFLFFFFLIF